MKVTNGNSKLSASIPSINLPAGITCRSDAPCARGCYAKKGNFAYKNIQQCYQENLKHYLDDKWGYFEDIIAQLNKPLVIYKYVRWHSSGDIVDAPYLCGMVRVAQACKSINFLCFTKKYELVNWFIKNNGELPKNLHIVFSGWDADWKFENPYNLPVSLVRFKNDTRDFSKCKQCNNKCYECLECWKLKKGQTVVFDKH